MRDLDLSPINRTPGALRSFLGVGTPVKVVLEPGDMTRYVLLITPLRDAFPEFGIPRDAIDEYLLVTYLSDRGGPSVWIRSQGPYGTHDTSGLSSNVHTQRILAEFLSRLLSDDPWREVDWTLPRLP